MDKHFLLSSGKKQTAIPIALFDSPEFLKNLTSRLGWRILQELAEPGCPMDIAKKLGIHEQKVYYYINKFKAAKLIREVKRERRHGTVAVFYQTKDYAFGFRMRKTPEFETLNISSPKHSKLMEPFVSEGRMNSKIIVGSPDQHGPWKARASDSCCAIDFALFLGAFTDGTGTPNYKLDTEIREKDLKGNLILIGGPTANMITNKVNSKLPIHIDLKNDVKIFSTLSKKSYAEDENGLIVSIQNPWDKKSRILVVAGKRFQGTRAAIIALITKAEKVFSGNKYEKSVMAKVVRGYDMDGDGIIDSAEILE
ncbi:MAG: S-layer protein [Candidatus Aenigmarchaeota archaeon]|nr:S-layer protein [Candidatus Aenigmarchaeota archaeon]